MLPVLPKLTSGGRRMKGFSMLEVLIAVFVIAIGVLGVSSAQLLSLKNNQGSYYRSQANFLVMDMLDRMRANPSGVQDGDYDNLDTDNVTPSAASPACASNVAGCTSAQIAAADKTQWAANFSTGNNIGLIPGSAGTVSTTVNGTETTATITVTWAESAWDNDPNGDGDSADATFGDTTGRVSMTVRL